MMLLSLYVLIFILLSGLLAAIDAAVLSVTRPEIDELIIKKRWGAPHLLEVKRNLTRAVVVIVILTNTVNVLGPILVSRKAFELFGTDILGLITAVLALGSIVFSEIIPKSLGAHYAPLVGRITAPVIQVITVALYPLVIVLARLSKLFTVGTRPIGTEDQIRALVTIGRRAGYIESDEGRMIHQAFILNDRTAADIMTPVAEMAALPAGNTVREAVDHVRGSRYSRYPVYDRSIDQITGIVLSRDILEAFADERVDDSIATIVREGLIVDAKRRSDELLVLFRDQHLHLAIVQNQGKTIGVVTLEDVLEELVGEIEDEKDVEQQPPSPPTTADH